MITAIVTLTIINLVQLLGILALVFLTVSLSREKESCIKNYDELCRTYLKLSEVKSSLESEIVSLKQKLDKPYMGISNKETLNKVVTENHKQSPFIEMSNKNIETFEREVK